MFPDSPRCLQSAAFPETLWRDSLWLGRPFRFPEGCLHAPAAYLSDCLSVCGTERGSFSYSVPPSAVAAAPSGCCNLIFTF